MAFNFSELIAKETKKQEEAAATGSGGGIGFKTVYPFNNGRLEFRLLGNEPSGLLYRELCFHEYWSDSKKQKVACLHNMYGLDCPICNAVSNVQATFDDKDIWGKYGFKKQGIMFAKLVGFSPDNYFGDGRNNPPKIGDIVLFMFPKSVITALRDLIIEYQDDVENIFTNNTARVVTLKIGTQANGFPEYTFYVKGNTDILCVDSLGNPDQMAFNDFMLKMPNLNDVKFSSAPDENVMNIQRTVVEEINRKYFGASVTGTSPMPNPVQMASQSVNVVNESMTAPQPSQIQQPSNMDIPPFDTTPVSTPNITSPIQPVVPPTPVVEAPSAPVEVAPVQVPDTQNNNVVQRPACFGNNEYNEKCAACPFDAECV